MAQELVPIGRLLTATWAKKGVLVVMHLAFGHGIWCSRVHSCGSSSNGADHDGYSFAWLLEQTVGALQQFHPWERHKRDKTLITDKSEDLTFLWVESLGGRAAEKTHIWSLYECRNQASIRMGLCYYFSRKLEAANLGNQNCWVQICSNDTVVVIVLVVLSQAPHIGAHIVHCTLGSSVSTTEYWLEDWRKNLLHAACSACRLYCMLQTAWPT